MSFVGSSFSLESATPIGLATLRVRFTQNPKVVLDTDVDDGTNTANYILAGPSTNYAINAVAVDADTLSIDLFLAAPLQVGLWTLSVINIISDEAYALSAPTSIQFNVTQLPQQATLANGAVNLAISNVLRKHLNPALKGPGWDSMIAAISAGDQINADNAALAFDQLFLSTASGIYLDRRAGDQGIRRPVGVDLSEELFRDLAVIFKSEKLTQEAILDVLEIFCGSDAVRASITSTAFEPYALQDGDELVFVVDGKTTITVPFHRNEFARIGVASAVEVAAAITRAARTAGNKAFATTYVDPETNGVAVQIYSGSLGLGSSLQIISGRAQVELAFPQVLYTTSGSSPFAVWNVSLSPTTLGNVRFTETSGIYDLNTLHEGDLAYIYGNEFAASLNQGVFTISKVFVSSSTQWFEITNPSGTAQTPINQILFKDLMFFRPVRKTIYDSVRPAIVAQAGSGIDVVLPATIQVNRGPGQAAYLQDPILDISSLVRKNGLVTVVTSTNHGMLAGDNVIIDGAYSTNARPAIAAGTPSGNFAANVASGTTDASLATNASLAHTFQSFGHKSFRLPEKMALIVGGLVGVGSNVTSPVVLEILTETVTGDGSRQDTYKWTNLATHTSTTGHREFGASLLNDGRVFVTGGTDGTDGAGTANGNWNLFSYTRVPAVDVMTTGILAGATTRAGHSQSTIYNGRVIIAGGWITPHTPLASSYIFNPSTSGWAALTSMNIARMRHQSITLPNNDLLVVGGQTSVSATLNRCEIYHLVGNTWSFTGSMTYARYGFGMVKLPDGRILVVGGYGYDPTQSTSLVIQKTCEIYDPNTGYWTPIDPMFEAREFPVVEYLAERNVVLVAGGLGRTTLEQLDLATMKWSVLPTPLSNGTFYQSSSAIIGTDTFALIGGASDVGISTTKNSYLVIPGADTFGGSGLNGEHQVVSVLSPTSFTYKTVGQSAYSVGAAGATAMPEAAKSSPVGIPGAFAYDPQEGVAATAISSTLGVGLSVNQNYQSITLSSTAGFPDSDGWLVFNFGTDQQIGPLKYTGVIDGTRLAIDSNFVFPFDVAAGSNVYLLSGRGPFIPPVNELIGALYVTGSQAGRAAAVEAIKETVAAGVDLNVTVLWPGDVGLGNQGYPDAGVDKLSDIIRVFGSDDIDSGVAEAKG